VSKQKAREADIGEKKSGSMDIRLKSPFRMRVYQAEAGYCGRLGELVRDRDAGCDGA